MEGTQLENIAGWVAPAATMIAAMMTAMNLGARVTGWGFVVFTLGSICWTIVGLTSGQTNLIAANVFLTLVNLLGIWRWLGRQSAYEDGAKAATDASRAAPTPSLFTATAIAGMPVVDADGVSIGNTVEALIACETGEVSYVVVATGGIAGVAEQLRAVPRSAIRFGCEQLGIELTSSAFEALPPLQGGNWPADPASQQAHAA